MGRPEAEKSGLLNCRMSHNFNVSSPGRRIRRGKGRSELYKKELVPSVERVTLSAQPSEGRRGEGRKERPIGMFSFSHCSGSGKW